MRETTSKALESLIVVLKFDDYNNLTPYKTFGPLNVSASKTQPLTMANISGTGWSPTFTVDGSKIVYGVNGGPSAAIMEPVRTTPPGRYYYIKDSIGNSTIEIDGTVVANISNAGLVTPLLFSPDSREISWMVLKDRKLYLKKLKLK